MHMCSWPHNAEANLEPRKLFWLMHWPNNFHSDSTSAVPAQLSVEFFSYFYKGVGSSQRWLSAFHGSSCGEMTGLSKLPATGTQSNVWSAENADETKPQP